MEMSLEDPHVKLFPNVMNVTEALTALSSADACSLEELAMELLKSPDMRAEISRQIMIAQSEETERWVTRCAKD